jgi:hypothetical protein
MAEYSRLIAFSLEEQNEKYELCYILKYHTDNYATFRKGIMNVYFFPMLPVSGRALLYLKMLFHLTNALYAPFKTEINP